MKRHIFKLHVRLSEEDRTRLGIKESRKEFCKEIIAKISGRLFEALSYYASRDDITDITVESSFFCESDEQRVVETIELLGNTVCSGNITSDNIGE